MTSTASRQTSVFDQVRDSVVRAGAQSPVIMGAGFMFAAMIIVFASQNSQFLSSGNLGVIASQIGVLGLVTMGQMVVLLSGGFDLSISGVVPLAAVSYVAIANSWMSGLGALGCALLIGALAGLANGLVVTKLKVNALIATLGMMSICQGIAYVVTNGKTYPIDSPGDAWVAERSPLGAPWFVVLFAIICALLFGFLRYTVPGRALYAVGGGREAARLAGMRADASQCLAFGLSGVLAAFAGVVVSSQLLAGSPGIATDLTLLTITAAVLGGVALHGGVGGVFGTLLGVVIIVTLRNGLALVEVSAFYQLIATGLVLLAAVSLAQIKVPTRRRRRGRGTGTQHGVGPVETGRHERTKSR